jgi:hypothetical protein
LKQHYTAILEDAHAANGPFDVRGRRPVCCIDLPIPSYQRLARIRISWASIEEGLERAQRYDPSDEIAKTRLSFGGRINLPR